MVSSLPADPPASVRNATHILEILRRVLSPPGFRGGHVLEIAAGSGYHAAVFAAALPHLVWQPSDPDEAARVSIAARAAHAALPNLRAPLEIDVRGDNWPLESTDALVCINMIHISPWEATLGLFRGAGRLMPHVGTVITYGPYAIDGDFLAESNVAFDQSLRSRDPAWGIRDVAAVAQAAGDCGFKLVETVRMPANNLTLVFSRP